MWGVNLSHYITSALILIFIRHATCIVSAKTTRLCNSYKVQIV